MVQPLDQEANAPIKVAQLAPVGAARVAAAPIRDTAPPSALKVYTVRAGDTLSAIAIWLALHVIGFRGRGLAFINIALVTVWLAVAIGLVRRHRALVRTAPQGGS